MTFGPGSLSARRAWIEIILFQKRTGKVVVALRKESVDRNRCSVKCAICRIVALRKESVDRNALVDVLPKRDLLSLSARRAWIEIARPPGGADHKYCRSPQGERG